MSWIRAIGKEAWSLFVDDGHLVVLTMTCIAIGILIHRSHFGVVLTSWPSALLFTLSLMTILVESVVRAARRARASAYSSIH